MNKKNRILFYFMICLLSFGTQTYAQKSSVNATINPAEIQIGEQALITLDVKAPKGRRIALPQFNYADTLITGIEVIEQSKPDTVISHEVMSITQRYLVTSFDSALYNIPYISIIDLDTNDTIKSRNLGLKVIAPMLSDSTLAYLELMNTAQTDSINFEALQLSDLRDIQEPPFVWQDLLEYLWLAVAIAILLIIIIIGIFLLTRKKKKGYFFKPKVKLPPHVIALNALDKLKAEKIWQQGREKEFYTTITDALRTYIEERYMINAYEKTSDEILQSLEFVSESESAQENLAQILKLADLVKFAKYKPFTDENDLSIMNAYLFVNQTKIEAPAEPLPGEKAMNPDSEPKTNS